jgi:hypothetical protein
LEHKNCSSFNFFSGITGSYVDEEQAAKAHDLAALKYWGTGPNTKLNFNVRITCCLALTDALGTGVSCSRTEVNCINICYVLSDF